MIRARQTLTILVVATQYIQFVPQGLAQSEAVPRNQMIGFRALGGVFIPDGDVTLRGINARFAVANPIFGLGLSYYPLAFLGLEGEFAASLVEIGGDTPISTQVYHPRGQLVLQGPWRISPFAFGGGGAQFLDPSLSLNPVRSILHYGAGLKVLITRNVLLRFEGRQNLVFENGFFAENINPFTQLEIFGALGFTFGGVFAKDRDQDGVFIPKDKCPLESGIERDGCPDSDGDGQSDKEDLCPQKFGRTYDGCPDSDGDGQSDNKDLCPQHFGRTKDGCPDKDNDNIVDSRDSCPDLPGTLANGCPNPDSDGDFINDKIDRCPDKPGPPPSGCPNKDGDALVDLDDQCPNEPETVNGIKDQDGCPDELPVEVKRFNGQIRGIRFLPGKARIRRVSFRVLNQAVFVLKQYPDLQLRIEGHTDNSGPAFANLLLSQQRAASVKRYLVANGIDSSRIKTEGLGEDYPVASNRSPAGRRRNRRIEFTILQSRRAK